ncbi:hypothetical protein Poly24_40180 [Rosistilla carotiformis]|uniref:Uncharacterized protein n=1 Tax=Rosistilla carotiformis TaxID=2528017 RepID=A0A518JXN3_9BACT|nr:hypothetical protein Poly24_40180 [Rosistilla carotiformis]
MGQKQATKAIAAEYDASTDEGTSRVDVCAFGQSSFCVVTVLRKGVDRAVHDAVGKDCLNRLAHL